MDKIRYLCYVVPKSSSYEDYSEKLCANYNKSVLIATIKMSVRGREKYVDEQRKVS